MPFFVFVLLALVLLILVSGGSTFCIACVRRKELPWLDRKTIEKTPYAKYYDNIVMGDAFLREHASERVEIQSYDGLNLSAVWVPAERPKGTILLAHGYRSSMLVDFSLAFGLYHNMGMNILLPDQRAHGNSEGKYITFGVKESRDMEAWVAFHNTRFGEYSLILSGLSMGASTVLYLADEKLPSNVKGIIADCGFTSPREIITSVFRRVVHLPAVPSVWVADLFAKIFAGFGLSEKDTRKTLANSRLPVLMFHGVDDSFVPCKMSEQGYAACTSPKELCLVEGAGHAVSFLVEKESYTQMVTAFIDRNLEEK